MDEGEVEAHEARVVNVQPNFIEVRIAWGKIAEVNRRLLPAGMRDRPFHVGQRLRIRGAVRGPSFRSVEAIEEA